MSNGRPNPEDRQPDLWKACEAGELNTMVQHLDARQRRARRRQVYSTALVSTSVFACVVLVLGTFMDGGKSNYGGISCSYCRDHLAEYQQHQSGDSIRNDTEFVASMRTHLEKCTFCRGQFNSLYPDTPIADTATRSAMQFALRPMFADRHTRRLF